MMKSNKFIPEKILIFDLKGPNAHFRKFYTNSSSLSYTVPPRTVIAGVIAGLLGMPSEHHPKENNDDVYYEKFALNNSFISVSLKTPVKKIMQTINYYNTEPKNNSLRYQTPIEILTPADGNEIVYRIYFSHSDDNIFEQLNKRLQENKFVFPPFLGISEFLGTINFVDEADVKTTTDAKTEINSICKLSFIKEFVQNGEFKYLTETMPAIFDNYRNPGKPKEYVIEITSRKIQAIINKDSEFYSVLYNDSEKPIIEIISPM